MLNMKYLRKKRKPEEKYGRKRDMSSSIRAKDSPKKQKQRRDASRVKSN
jgi:hypothetical protein